MISSDEFNITIVSPSGTELMWYDKDGIYSGSTITTSEYHYLQLPKGTYTFTAYQSGYYKTAKEVQINGNTSISMNMNKCPAANTISLFHCNSHYGEDAKGYAIPQRESLLGDGLGVFLDGAEKGVVEYQDYCWDSVWSNGCWTIDYWLYPVPVAVAEWAVDMFLGGSEDTWYAAYRQQTQTDGLMFFISGSMGWEINNVVIPVTFRSWHHIAVVNDTTTIRIYLDGSLKFLHPITFQVQSRGNKNIFGEGWNGRYQSNSIRDEIRISTGVRWSSNFVPPISKE